MEYKIKKESFDRLSNVYNLMQKMNVSGRDNAFILVTSMDTIKGVISEVFESLQSDENGKQEKEDE